MGVEFLDLEHLAAAHAAPERLLEPDPHRLLEAAPDGAAQQLGGAAPQQLFRLLVDVGEAAFAVDGGEGLAAAHRTTHAHVVAQQGPHPVALGRNLLQRALDPHDPPGVVAHRVAEGAHPQAPPAQGEDLHLLVERLAGRGAGGDQRLDLLAPLGRVQ